MSTLDGACQCGEIKVTISKGGKVGLCHCSDCRKATGGAYGISIGAPKSELQISGSPKMYSAKGQSGNPINRYFCGTCGSPLYVECSVNPAEGSEGQDGPMVYVKTGLFPIGNTPRPSVELFVENLEDWEKPIEGTEVYRTQ